MQYQQYATSHGNRLNTGTSSQQPRVGTSGMTSTNGRRPSHGANRKQTAEGQHSADVPVKTVDRVIEVTEIQVLERVVPIHQKVQREKVVHVPRIEEVERRIPVPKTVYEDKIIEVPQIQYKEVVTEKIVEVVEYQTQFVPKEVYVPEHVNVPIVQPTQAPVEQEIDRNVPVLVELHTVHQYLAPGIRAKYTDIPVPIYAPRYIEVPVPTHYVFGEKQIMAPGFEKQKRLSKDECTMVGATPTAASIRAAPEAFSRRDISGHGSPIVA